MDGYHPNTFPAPTYARHVLGPAFDSSRQHLFGPLLVSTQAHLVMLAEQGILDRERAARLLAAVAEASAQGPSAYRYDPGTEDLYFAVEKQIIEACGEEVGGDLPLARSRNDLDGTMARIVLRDHLLRVIELTLLVRERLSGLASRHLRTVMPGVTHTQEAQPTTLAHYLAGVLGPLQRDGERLRLAYLHTNQSPLGVLAFTTTGLPISRERTAELLGFSGIVENGYDAVGAADYMLETVAAMRTSGACLVRFVNDLLIWVRTEVGVARIGDEFIQISSIMPQKRNPVVLEHIRARIGYVFGDASTVEVLVHGAAFGDTVDVEDPIYVPLFRCCETTEAILELLAAVLASITFDRERFAERAGAGFGAATELADRLSESGLSYRQAHQVVSRLVAELRDAGHDLRALTPPQVEGAVAAVTRRRVLFIAEQLSSITDADAFVARRSILGGPAPKAVRHSLTAEARQRRGLARWLDSQKVSLAAAQSLLDRAIADLRA